MAESEAKQELTFRELMQGNILVLTVSRIIWSLSMSVVFPYQSLFIQELGGSKPVIGLITALGNVTGMVFYPLGGYLADKSGRAKLVGYATMLYASSFIIYVLAPSWQWVAVAIAFQQMVLFYMPALNAIMADSIPPGARGRILSLTIAVPEAVRILAPFIGGWFIEKYTLIPAMRMGYTLSFIMAFLVAVMRIRYLKETIEQTGFEWNIPLIIRESYGNVFESVRWIIGNMKGYSVIAMMLIFIGSLVQPFWVIYATEIIGLSALQWGQMSLIAGLIKVAVSIVVGNLVDRLGSKKCMLISFFVSAPAMLAFPYANGFLQTTVVYIVLVVGNAFIWISSGVYLANTIPRNVRGRIMAGLGQGISLGISGGGYAQGFILFIPSMLGSIVSGFIYEVNPMYPWYLNVAVLALCLLLVVKLVTEPETAEV
ncbi:MFS transporter [Candidatus Bathyarchaeota archaeon]|nr:MFS transporter [Candidatus Bathyarchaeota archaeon]